MTDIEATKLLDAAKQALEVLEDFVDDPRCQKQIDEAATALRQAISELEQRSIAEAEQEPVGCIAKDGYTLLYFDDGKPGWQKLPPFTELFLNPQPKREADIDLYSLLACNVEAGVFENQVAPILLDNGFGPQVIKENT